MSISLIKITNVQQDKTLKIVNLINKIIQITKINVQNVKMVTTYMSNNVKRFNNHIVYNNKMIYVKNVNRIQIYYGNLMVQNQ